MHLHFERNINAKCDCSILSLSWMGKVPDEIPEEEGWKLNRTNYYQEGWLATGNVRGIVGVTFTTSHCKRSVDMPLRTNYNLRGHRSDVILVKWNEPYQKLASCDSSGVIFVWIKYEGRWSIELINDRSTPVTHFSWSHDGRMALICYQDGFVLVGSVAGQRYWSSMLTLEARITSGCWTPDDAYVYLGTASAHLVVMDVHGAMISQVQLTSEDGVTSMAWSCEKFKMEEGEDENSSLSGNTTSTTRTHILAVALGSGGIVLMRGYDDVAPIRISTGLDGKTLAMEWANSQELLAVAGALLQDNKNTSGETNEATTYRNVVKFYSDSGILLYTVNIPYTQCAVSSLTWGHAGRRLFVATGGAVHVARVWRRVAPLALLARVAAAAALPAAQAAARLPLPPPLRPLIASLFANTIRCCVPEPSALRQFVSRPPGPPARLHCTMLRHDDDESTNGSNATNSSSSHSGGGGGGGSYTLYLEHLGGLVPLLKGKRTSKIRPEFVIFDPQCEGYPENRSSTESTTSSSSSGSSSTSRSSNSAYNVPRSFTTPSDSSDTERDEGCSGSPRLQRRRKARRRQQRTTTLQGNLTNGERQRLLSDREQPDSEDLTYIDSLPEDIRLVEVTSNIWGTKFKIHGLAKNVPANLGQVTYKTSLLHLQPRQMTLVITELRDDFPIGPDPNFNPNIFSEDEEDVFQTPTLTPSTPVHKADVNQNEKQRVPRPGSPVAQSLMNSHIELPININNNLIPALARAESYEEEFPYVDLSEMMNFCESLRSNGNTNIVTQNPVAALERRSTSNQSRHAISPLRCDGSVPTLQSPKNAVAPSDIIFERSSPQTVSCGGVAEFYGRRGEFCAARNDHQHNLQQIKNSLATIDQSSVSYDVTRQVTIKRPDQHLSETIAKRVMSINKADTIVEVMISNNKNTTSKGFTQDEIYNNIINTGKRKDDPSFKMTPKCDDLKFIDEEVPTDTYPLMNLTERTDSTAVERTSAVPISPACSTAPVIDTMIRSCSVGYLDLVDPQLITGDVTLAMLRKETPKRLILVNRKTRNNCRRTGRKTTNQKCFILEETVNEPQKDGSNKTPILNKCGKSKSLDSSDVFTVSDSVLGKLPPLPTSIEESTKPQDQNDYEMITNLSTNLKNVALNKNECKTPKKHKKNVAKDVTKLSFFTTSKTPQLSRKNRQEYPECSKCRCVTPSTSDLPLDLDPNSENTHTCSACLSIEASCKGKVTPGTSRSHRERSRTLTDPRKSDKESDSDFASSLEQLLWRLRGTDGKTSEPGRTETEERSPPVASAPASPRLPRSSPASPALAAKRSKRNSSASPIRQILNSPLLNRRRHKSKPPESSDEELIQSQPVESIVNSRNYRDLESFQKAQLRQKLKRGKIEPIPSNSGGPAASWPRRQLVMHNKAPMWNENSQVYQLDFGGRVTQESAKNFQIEYRGKQVMQFGRIDGNAYTLDFQYPFSALQAFAVALANVTQRLK